MNTTNHTENLNKSDISALLNEAISNGIINISDVQRKINMTKREEYLKLHKEKFEIWQGKNGSWYTYLPDETKKQGRRLVKKSTLTKVEDEIVDYFKSLNQKEKEKKITLEAFYHTWLDYKQLETRSTMYIRRIDSDWVKYYKDTAIVKIPLSELEYDALKEWALKIVRERELTKKQYYNMTVIIRQALDYAVQKKLIIENPFSAVHIDGKLFKIKKRPDNKTQVFLLDEQPQIEAEAYNDFTENEHDACLTIPFAFQTGLRVGEIVALKEEDIRGNYIHVERMEVRIAKQLSDGTWSTSEYKVVDYTKSDAGDRWVYLTSKSKKILNLILENNRKHGYSDNGFLFLNKDGRIHAKGVDCRIRKYCRHIGISEKATHKIRKTLISTLIDNNTPIDLVRSMVGHEDARTTYNNYCFSRLSESQTENALERALCG